MSSDDTDMATLGCDDYQALRRELTEYLKNKYDGNLSRLCTELIAQLEPDCVSSLTIGRFINATLNVSRGKIKYIEQAFKSLKSVASGEVAVKSRHSSFFTSRDRNYLIGMWVLVGVNTKKNSFTGNEYSDDIKTAVLSIYENKDDLLSMRVYSSSTRWVGTVSKNNAKFYYEAHEVSREDNSERLFIVTHLFDDEFIFQHGVLTSVFHSGYDGSGYPIYSMKCILRKLSSAVQEDILLLPKGSPEKIRYIRCLSSKSFSMDGLCQSDLDPDVHDAIKHFLSWGNAIENKGDVIVIKV